MTARDLEAALQSYANADDVVFLQRFFKTGPGQYGEGDQFIGVRVPATRRICRDFADPPLPEIQKLLTSPIHKHRLAAAIILANQYPRADEQKKRAIYDLYLENVRKNRINNWDIVDTTAEYVLGAHLQDRDKKVLHELARSDNLWARRVSVMSTFGYIKRGDPTVTLDIIDILLHDREDLIQKAVGWMLREIGKRIDEQLLTDFLDKHAHDMPRTALRYALEKLPPGQRAHYLMLKQTT